MLFEINPSSTVPIYTQIKDQIRRSIASGLLSPEGKLPSVRDLALHLRINPNTVAKAYRELELEGVLFSRKGQGTFVCQEQPRVSRDELLARVTDKVDAMIVHAVQMGLSKAQIRRLLDERLERRGEAEGKGGAVKRDRQ